PLAPAQQGDLELVLDVGAADDADPSAQAHLDEARGLSERMADGARTFRELDAGVNLLLRFGAGELPLAEDGVPYRDALLTVTYRDTVDETNCYRWSSSRAYCRPQVFARLDYSENPPLEWHALGAVAGLDTGEWSRSSVFIESNPWQTLRAIDGYFEFRIYYPRQEGAWQPLPIDEIRLRFVEPEEFDAERDADRAARTLERSDYVASHTLDPADYGGAEFVTFARNYLDKIYPSTVPEPSEIGRPLTTFEVPGEREPVSLGIYAFDDLDAVNVSVTDLSGATGRIQSTNVAIELVEAIDKRWMYGYDPYYGVNPWYLSPNRPFSVPPGTSRQLWLTIDVPQDARAGTYEGAVIVDVSGRYPAGAPPAEVGLTLTVLDVELQPPAATPYVYHSPYMAQKYYAPSRSIAARDMAEHDINPIIYLDAQIDVGSYEVDFRDLADELDEFEALGILPPEPRVGILDNASSLWGQLCPGAPIYEVRCDDFDAAYTHVLRTYRAFFEQYGVTPALSFTDEPGTDPERRIRSNYLNRLTRESGMRTWVTYYPRCEEPLAGHHLTFDDMVGALSRQVPEWLSGDPALRAHWDFESGATDASSHGNDGELRGTAVVTGGLLALPDEEAYMRVQHDESLSLTDVGTAYLWLRPDACPSGFARYLLSKSSGTEDANYVLYFFGDYDGRYPDNLGQLRMYAAVDGRWTSASGTGRIDCTEGIGQWHNIWWTYDAALGGTLYHNGHPDFVSRSGPLATNEAAVDVGRIQGAMDDVLLLDRALSDDEILRLTQALNADYDQDQSVTLSLDVSDPAEWPSTLSVSLMDADLAPAEMETTKAVLVDGVVVWSASLLPSATDLVQVDIAEYLTPGRAATISFRVTNGQARREDLTVYFVEDEWRGAEWVVDGAADGDNWAHELAADDSGALGPMAPELDDRVYALRYVTQDEIDRTRAGGDSFSYYTTYPANQPVILNNRFLNGLYASALGAEGVYVYAYGDWGSQPWDDTEPSSLGRLGTDAGQRGQGGYQLVLPSWEKRVYDTVVFESLREGVEDSRVIATLEQAIRENPGATADAAKAWLDDLYSRPSHAYSPRYMSSDPSRPIHRYADRSDEILTDLAGSPDDFEFFDRTRRRMLDYIVTLERGPSAPSYVPIAER
ncbi:MAG: LamG-like jellyroll fold domain-containing protein, partial [Anaerolineae bacterium]